MFMNVGFPLVDKENSGRQSIRSDTNEADSIQLARRARTDDLKKNSTYVKQEDNKKEISKDPILNFNSSEEHVINPNLAV
jgi:hypothetical protein